MSAIERLGFVETRSGVVVVADFGSFGLWSGKPPHRAAHAALAQGLYAFEHEGLGAVAIPNVPTGREIPVMGLRILEGELEGLWQAVYLDILPGATPVRTIEAGTVVVDAARLGFFDLEALEAWQHDEPLDGKADVMFWGLHGEEVAARFGAPHDAEESIYGFRDLHLSEAEPIVRRLEALRATGELRFAYDYRPHSHHYVLMKQLRASETESGMLGLGRPPVACCGLSTTWGDGEFPVMLDFDASGALMRVGVFFATPEAQENLRAVNG